MKTRIPYTQPSITELEVRYATDAAANDWGTHRPADLAKQGVGFTTAVPELTAS